MNRTSRVIANLLLMTAIFTMPRANAQGTQNWQYNQQNQINQDAASGLINSNQAANLQTKEAQIQAQEQMYRAQNGGRLTGQERSQVDSELRSVNHGLTHDMRRDGTMNAANAGYMQNAYGMQSPNGFGAPAVMPQNMNGYGMPNGYALQNGYVPQNVNGYVAPNGYAQQNVNGYQQTQNNAQQGWQHHHHGLLNQLNFPGLNGGQYSSH